MAQGTVKQKVKTEPKKYVPDEPLPPLATSQLILVLQRRKAHWSSDRQQSHQAKEGCYAEAGQLEEGAQRLTTTRKANTS